MNLKHNFAQKTKLPEMEEKILEFWQKNKIFEKSISQRRDSDSYIFYDGPPFATGMPHYGHLLASTTKDLIPRYQTMKGKKVERIWGWDCHGLPIENIIEKKLKLRGKNDIEAIGIDKFNNSCANEVLRLDKEWENIITRLGRFVDFANNYKTMDTNFMESVWWGFKKLYDKGLIYQGRKVILYCPHCQTPLSNFEIAMDDSYDDVETNSIFVKFPLVDQPNHYFLAWTTTPWTIPGNVALAVDEKADYVLVESNNEFYYLAKNLVEKVFEDFKIVKEIKGSDLIDLKYQPIFKKTNSKNAYKVVASEFVNMEDGTGIVHTAPCYGEEDYVLGQRYNLPVIEVIDKQGKFIEPKTPFNNYFFKKANPEIIKNLEENNFLLKVKTFTHSYPFCYRCHAPLYYQAMPAWFLNVQKIKKQLIKLNNKINWFPKHLKLGRFLKGLENAPDWNISRNRFFGTPIPIWQAEIEKNGKKETVFRIIGSLQDLKKWAINPEKVKDLDNIHRQYVDDIEVYVDDEKTIVGKRVEEVFDCWVESGSMPFARYHYPFENKKKFEENYPSDFVSEYIAQTRAWFYTMHVLSVGLFDEVAFKNVLTTGTILAKDGTKMSKSKNNFPDPMLIINQYGSDALRLYLMSSPVMKAENLNFNEKEVSDLRRKVLVIWYNVFSFYQNVAIKHNKINEIKTTPKNILDQYLIAKTTQLNLEITKALDDYNVVLASRLLINFINDLSTWYLRLSRERLKTNQESAQIFGFSLEKLAQMAAPIMPFFSELTYQNLDNNNSIHLSDWPQLKNCQSLFDSHLIEEMEIIKKVVEVTHAERKSLQIKVRQPLAKLKVKAQLSEKKLEKFSELMQLELNIKEIEFSQSDHLTVELDANLTDELIKEGEARELMHKIARFRKKNNLQPQDKIDFPVESIDENWRKAIEKKTNSRLVIA